MLKVLIVDDDNNVRQCLNKCINWEDLGFEVVGEAFNGVEALKIALEDNIDVIITDIKMPMMDGTELCKKIREVISDASIIILSAYEDFTTAQLALRYDVNEYILKPIDYNKLQFLTEILKNIKENKEGKNYINHLLTSKNIKQDILFYLKGNETQYFIDFFREINKCITCDFTAISAICFNLITVLYDYLLDVGVNPDNINQKKLRIGNELIKMKNQQDVLNYTKKLYFDILQFDHHNSDNFYTVLIENIKKNIQSNYSNPSFNVIDIADCFNFSADYIGRIFKKYTNTTIGAYISEIRLEKATALLKDTDIPINDIAAKVGYANSNYFTKVFKLKHNMTPSSYRLKFK